MLSSYPDSVMRATAISVLRNLLPIILITFLLTGACADLSDYDNEQVQSSLNDSLIVTTETWDVEMVLMQNGYAKILIEGSYAISYQTAGRQETRIDGPVYVQLFDSLGNVETEAWSKRAIYLEAQKEFELYEDVEVKTTSGNELYTEYLVWSQDTGRITTPRFVSIITPPDSITGRGFDGLTDLSDYGLDELSGTMVID